MIILQANNIILFRENNCCGVMLHEFGNNFFGEVEAEVKIENWNLIYRFAFYGYTGIWVYGYMGIASMV
ncbi:unnamed protein product [Rhizophagus irregularis]|nr:unnamed protein product [Rhizophagus irregularis]